MAVARYNSLLFMYEERERRKIERKRIRDLCDPFDVPDTEFFRLWRMNKPMALYLIEKLKDDLEPQNAGGLPAHIKVLCTIQFFANGGYQRQVGQDHSLCHAQTTASNYISKTADSIYRRLFAEWVHFPGTERARTTIAARFREKFNVPDILGLIDCTHVKIFPPSGPQGAQYKNRRKDAHTINVQLIADADCNIIHVNARYPGRVHDAFVWRNSAVREELKRLFESRIGKYFLLGDSGYPLEPWLLTPILQPTNSLEEEYTNWHCQVRNGIERTNGYLKGSLRCLGIDRVLHYAPEKASLIIYACCVIYNIMKNFRVEMDLAEVEEDLQNENVNIVSPAALLRLARNRRDELIQTLNSFNN